MLFPDVLRDGQTFLSSKPSSEKYSPDLQLSGHTHAGQLFPLQYIYNVSGYDSFGFYGHGDTQTFVSAGAGGWMFPFRSEEYSQYNIITLMPASESGEKKESR